MAEGSTIWARVERTLSMTCDSGKKIHTTARDALEFSIFIVKKVGGYGMRLYECPKCHYWHLSSKLRSNRILK